MNEVLKQCGFKTDEVLFTLIQYAMARNNLTIDLRKDIRGFFYAGSQEGEMRILDRMMSKMELTWIDVLRLMQSLANSSRTEEQREWYEKLLHEFQTIQSQNLA